MTTLVRRFGYFILAICVMGSVSLYVNAQCAPTPTCPSISVDGPPGLPENGRVRFTLGQNFDLEGRDLEYNWTVSGEGTIVSGQGTRELLVAVPVDRSFAVTARLEVRDRRLGCSTSDSATMQYKAGPPPKRLIIDAAGSPITITETQIEQVAKEVNSDPTALLFVVIGRKNIRALDVTEKLLRERLGGVIKRMDQVKFLRSKQKADRTTFWLVPAGATPPSDHN